MVGYYVGLNAVECVVNVHLEWSRVGSSVHVMTNEKGI